VGSRARSSHDRSTSLKVRSIARCRIYEPALSFRVKQGKSRVAQWLRRCHVWMFPPDLMVTLFKTCVMSAMENGVGLWGADCVHKSIWKGAEQFWSSIARTILSVPSKTPIAAIQGDLGWEPFRVRACTQIVQFLERVTNMSDAKCLVRQALCVQRDMLGRGQPCWLANVKVFMDSLGSKCRQLWNEWFSGDASSRFVMRNMTYKCVRIVNGRHVRGAPSSCVMYS